MWRSDELAEHTSSLKDSKIYFYGNMKVDTGHAFSQTHSIHYTIVNWNVNYILWVK
jgi:hypothetical protein